MTLEIKVSEMKRVQLVEVEGRVDSATASELDETLNEAIDKGKNRIVIDLSKVQYMSSAGLRSMVGALKRVQHGSGDVRIAAPSERVQEVLELAGLDQIFKIFPSQVEAVGSF